MQSCALPPDDPLFRRYHDCEWGVPQTSDRVFFEKICLEGFQVGLSWRTILHKREAFRAAFDHFDCRTVAEFDEKDVRRLMANSEIIRNRQKIEAAISNARCVLKVQEQYGSLAGLFWQFEPQKTQRPARVTRQWLTENGSTAESTALARCLKQMGFRYVGPVNMYALMQALGIVNDHVHGCDKRETIEKSRISLVKPKLRDGVMLASL